MRNSATVLMLEPDADDRFLTTEMFEKHSFRVHVHFVNYSTQLFHYLEQTAQHLLIEPSLIIINMHTIPENGTDIVRKLKSDRRFVHIPVVILTGAVQDDAIVRECYALGANSVIQKPSSAADTDEKIAHFLHYWFATAELPGPLIQQGFN